jgi:ferrous iron transport protein B
MDEARRLKLNVDARRLARDLGVPVVPTSARFKEGLDTLLETIEEVATGKTVGRPHKVRGMHRALGRAVASLVEKVSEVFPNLPNARWVALRLLDGDPRISDAVSDGEIAGLAQDSSNSSAEDKSEFPARQKEEVDEILALAERFRWELGTGFQEHLIESIYSDAADIAQRAVTESDEKPKFDLARSVDRLITSRIWGFPIMLALLTLVFWITISGANLPSRMLSILLVDNLHPFLKSASLGLGFPVWLSGLLFDGIYLATAWVISVMLPPMAIFFPLFTLLEDLGYLPRVAFNLDHLFKRVGAHGKQALTMAMGFGCNAAGVVATRIIDSPRERLIAIITNNFALCNGRWPTQILVASLFIGVLVPAQWAGFVSAMAVVSVALLGIFLSFAVSWFLSRTWLRGEASTFTLELPPYRPPRILQTIYTSIIDRTIFVLWRAIIFAIPAGAVIWLVTNISLGNLSVAEYLIEGLNPLGFFIGMNGVILLAYVIAIPANEIIIPTILMLTVMGTGMDSVGAGTGVLFELESEADLALSVKAGGWSLLTAINLMLFSLIHNPCSTTIYTIFKETKSAKWTAVATFLPLVLGFLVTFLVARGWHLATAYF